MTPAQLLVTKAECSIRIICAVAALCIGCLGVNPLLCQVSDSVLVDLQVMDEPLVQVLDRISQLSGENIVYSQDWLDNYRVGNFSARASDVRTLLVQLVGPYGMEVEKVDLGYVLIPQEGISENQVIHGVIRDGHTGEVLVDAYVVDIYSQTSTFTNEYGYYSLELKGGQRMLTYSYLGYSDYNVDTLLKSDAQRDVFLYPMAPLQEVTVVAQPRGKLSEQSLNVSNIPRARFEAVPSLDGSVDLLRYTHGLSGVQTIGDGIGGISVRGGNSEHNLFLLDGVRIFNPTHINGVVSITSEAWINNARFYKSSGPARYAGALSSVMDVRTLDGNMHEYQTDIEADLVSTSLTFQGPWSTDKSSFLVSGRYSYLGNLVSFSDNNIRDIDELNDFDYVFYDVFVKNNVSLSDRTRLYFSFYHGSDRFGNTNEDYFHIEGGGVSSSLSNSFEWGNTMASVRLNSRLSKKIFLRSNFYFTRYLQTFEETNLTKEYEEGATEPSSIVERGIFGRSEVNALGAKVDVDYHWKAGIESRVGLELVQHRLAPATLLRSSIGDILDPSGIEEELRGAEAVPFGELSFFFENSIRWANGSLNFGANTAILPLGADANIQFNPRLQLQIDVADHLSLFASAGRSSQYFHLLQTSSFGLPSDAWVPLTDEISPQIAYTGALSAKWKIRPQFHWDLGGYWTSLDNLLDYEEGSLTGVKGFLTIDEWQDVIVEGGGQAYGLESEWLYRGAKWQSSLSFTWSRSERQFDEINQGRTFRDDLDRPWKIALSSTYRIDDKWSVAGALHWMKGNPITFPVGEIIFEDPESGDVIRIPIIERRNGLRLPNYFRSDLSLIYSRSSPKSKKTLRLGVYNLTNHQNILYYRFVAAENEEVQFLRASLVPLIPMVRYSLTF